MESEYNMFNRKLTYLFLMLFVPICFTPITAQTTAATLSGVVEDQKGAVVVGCKVTVTNRERGFERTVVTDDSGAYIVPLLPPATYTVTAEQTGFKRVQFPGVVLNVGDAKAMKIT